jgi:hypothetical protein
VKLRIAATEAEEGKPSEAPKADNAAAPDDAPGAGTVAERLEAALERELRKVENLRADLGRPEKRTQQSDRIARTLVTLTETLFRVRRLREPGNINGSNDDDLPADADGFRLALAHRIEVFVRSRADAELPVAGLLRRFFMKCRRSRSVPVFTVMELFLIAVRPIRP